MRKQYWHQFLQFVMIEVFYRAKKIKIMLERKALISSMLLKSFMVSCRVITIGSYRHKRKKLLIRDWERQRISL